MVLLFRKTVFQNKTINKTRATKSQENSAHHFGDNYQTNHLLKLLQDKIRLLKIEAHRVSTGN